MPEGFTGIHITNDGSNGFNSLQTKLLPLLRKRLPDSQVFAVLVASKVPDLLRVGWAGLAEGLEPLLASTEHWVSVGAILAAECH